jgi:predicted acetylornithine/succinylornithine family transaminase
VSPAPAEPTLASLQALEARSVIPSYARAPVAFVRGEGCRLWDSDGVEYLDFLAGVAVLSLGHCPPTVVEAIRDQSQRLIHASNLYYSAPAMQLSDRLARGSLGGKVFLCNSGAEAIEAALKLARRAHPGGEIVVAHGGFHGRTYGALSATAQETKQAPFVPLVPGFVVCDATDPEALAAAVGPSTAAVLIEPVQCETGIHPIPVETLEAARAACVANDAALIFDEVQTGVGRSGSLWAFQRLGVIPDAITSAKGLGGGMPIGALITGERLADTLRPGDHGSTFGGNPIACAAALAVLDIVDDERFLHAVRERGAQLAAGLAELPGVAAQRGLGLMQAIDLDGGGAPALVARALAEQRLLVNATGPATIRLEPPLTVSAAEIDDALARLRALLDAA